MRTIIPVPLVPTVQVDFILFFWGGGVDFLKDSSTCAITFSFQRLFSWPGVLNLAAEVKLEQVITPEQPEHLAD